MSTLSSSSSHRSSVKDQLGASLNIRHLRSGSAIPLPPPAKQIKRTPLTPQQLKQRQQAAAARTQKRAAVAQQRRVVAQQAAAARAQRSVVDQLSD